MSQTKGKSSQSKKNSRSSEVTPTEDAGDDFSRVTSAVSTPTMKKQQTRQSEENVELDASYEDLMMLE